MSSRLVVVDDTDSAINYAGPWFQDNSGSQDHIGNFGPAYLSTLHGTTSSASLSYAFNGTQVRVRGTNHPLNNSGVLDPQWACFVDNVSIGATAPFSSPENNWLFCENNQLSDGPHVLTVNATVAKKQTFWFDQIQYTPSASVLLEDKAVFVDNHDSALKFSHGWAALGGSANLTLVPNATVTFEFVGISMAWYGYIPVESPKAATTGKYSIDGSDAITFLLRGLPADATATVYHQKFFETAQLPAGSHTIVVTYLGGAHFTPLTLDYLVVQNGTSSSSPTSSGGQQPTSGAGSGSGSSTKSSGNNRGAIVGGIIGGLVFIVLAALLTFLYLRRRRQRKREEKEKEIDSYPQPFEYTPSAVTLSSRVHTPASNSVLGYSASGSEGQQQRQQPARKGGHGNRLHGSMPVGALNGSLPMNSKARREAEVMAAAAAHVPSGQARELDPSLQGAVSPALSESPTTRVIRHEDSGLRLPQLEPQVVEIPPLYTPG